MVSKEEDNFLRIVYLHYRVATGALTHFFDKKHPNLSADLNIPGNKSILKDLYIPPPKKKRVLYRGQWNTLYPPPGTTAVSSADLDLTLIVCLLRNIPPLVTEPRTGFEALPPSHDKSDGANIARLKYHKNLHVSHSKDGKLPDADFVRIWSELEQAIKGLDNSHATAASLKEAKTKMLDNSMVQLLSTQLQLVTKVSNFEEELKHISIHIVEDVQAKKQLKQQTETLHEKMKISEDNFEKEFKECKENVDRLSERLNTSEVQIYERVESIETCLEEIQKLQQSLDLQFTRIKTIAVESKKEKEDFEKDVQLLCSRIQVDITKHEERIAALEHQSGTFQEIKKDIDSLKRKIELIETKMKNQDEDRNRNAIRVIQEWEQDQTTFVRTRATRYILESLPLHNIIVVTGTSGCGKSSNIHHAALHLRDTFGYEIISGLEGPKDIKNYYNEDKQQVFVVDNICGKETINTLTLYMWRDSSDEMKNIFKDEETHVRSKNDGPVSKISSPRLLISCRLHIYKESEFQRILYLTKKECNLLSPELCLLPAEKMAMLHKYLPDDIIHNIKQFIENVDYFPLLCKLSKNQEPEDVEKLFTTPLKSIKLIIQNIILDKKEQFCALSLCLIFNDGFNLDWMKIESFSEKQKYTPVDIANVFDLDLSKEMHRKQLKAGFSTLNGTYLKLRGTEYRMIHDKIYKMAAVVCGQELPEFFIKYAPSGFIRDHFIFETLKIKVSEDNDAIVLSENQEEDYFERLLKDLKENDITSTFHNNQLMHPTFRNELISFFKRHDDVIAVLKKLDTQGCRKNNSPIEQNYPFKRHPNETTPLLEFASSGYCEIVHFMIVDVECDVNKTDGRGLSSLYIASERGDSAVVELLLENKADVSQFDIERRSSLHVACAGGHTNTVKLLLEHAAVDVSQRDMYGKRPLHAACEGGHTDTVELLLHNDADVNQCNWFQESPLHVACGRGHTATAELLLKQNADITKCDFDERSPLYVACRGGHLNTVKLLIHNKADVNQCNSQEKTPFYAACKGGHIDTIKLLIQNKADVSQCTERKQSPLFAACSKGHKDTVRLLLQINAAVSICNKFGESSLYAACKGGHMDTVELLLQNKADVSQCNEEGWSPLHAACRGGHTETVELLLQNKADVSQCDKRGWSPLHAVCSFKHNFEEGYSFFFRRRQFPEEKHVLETVKLLLKWNANVYMYDKTGKTPIDIARESMWDELENILEEESTQKHPD